MIRIVAVAAVAGALAGCGQQQPQAQIQCPDRSAILPASVGGPAFVQGLTARLAGPDRENTIVWAITEMHRRAPQLGGDVITDVLIAADCPNAIGKPDHSEAADRTRIKEFRAQVDQLLNQQQLTP
jgi:hypothetical protein